MKYPKHCVSASGNAGRANLERRVRILLLCAALPVALPSLAQERTGALLLGPDPDRSQERARGARPPVDLTELSLEALLDTPVVGASKYVQTQRQVAAAISVISREEIKAFGWRTINDVLASLPGMHTTYDRQYSSVGTRGFGLPGDFDTRLLLTINGNRVNDPTYDGAPLGRVFPLDIDLVERIEFIPGPGGALYGQNAMFGVVNVVTRKGGDIGGARMAMSYQNRQAQREGRLSWGQSFDTGLDILLSASVLNSEGEDLYLDFGEAGSSGVATGLDGEHDRELFASLALGSWSLDLISGDRRKDDPTGGYFSDPLMPGQFQRDSYHIAHLQFRQGFRNDTLQLAARAFLGHHEYSSRLSYGTLFSFPAVADWRGGELSLLSTRFAGHKLLVGFEVQQNVRHDQYVKDLADPANDIAIEGSGYRAGVYFQDEWQVADRWATTLGFRIDYNDITGTKASPRAGLIWQPTAATTVKAMYGRAHRAPNAYERDYSDGLALVSNPGLGGESIETLELITDHRVGAGLALRGSIYQWTMHDVITLDTHPVSGIPQYRSGETVKARGLELSADKAWASSIRLRGSLGIQDAGQASGRDLVNSPMLLAKLNLSTRLPFAGLRAGLEWQYGGPRLTLDGTRLGGSALTNLSLGTDELAGGLEVSLGIYNLFDKRYSHPAAETNWQNAIEQDGRSLRLKLGYRFQLE